MSVKRNIAEIKKSIQTKGSFGQNLIIMTLGSSSAYVLSFLFTPFITRIYEPEAYGTFAIFNALVINLSAIATIGYEQAVIIPKHKSDFYAIIQANFFILSVFCLSITVVLQFLDSELLVYFNILELRHWLYLIPLFVFVNVTGQIFTTVGVRSRKFKQISIARASSVFSSKTYALIYGLIISGKIAGFIIAELLGKLFFLLGLLLSKNIAKNIVASFRKLTHKSILKSAQEYKNYPLYTFPGVCLLTISAQLPLYVLARLYNTDDVGFFSLANTLLAIPMTLIGRSMETVFLQRSSELFNKGDIKQIQVIAMKIIKKIVAFGSVPLLIIAFFGTDIFKLAFGAEWSTSGIYARYIAIYVLAELVAFPISALYRVLRYERNFLYQSLFSFILIICFLFVGSYFQKAEWMVLIFSIGKLIESLVKLGLILRKLNVEVKNRDESINSN